MQRKDIQKAGFAFGKVCLYLGALVGCICIASIPNENTIINTEFILPSIISILVFLYGLWRTGGKA
jgi:hypothetical protein